MNGKIAYGLILATLFLMGFSSIGVATAQEAVTTAQDVVIIVNKNTPINSLTNDDIKAIFLAQKTQWENGNKIHFAVLKDGQQHDSFLNYYVQKSSSQFQRYYRTLVYTGKGHAPRTCAAEADLVAFVASTEGAIGYVSSGTDVGAVKAITIQ